MLAIAIISLILLLVGFGLIIHFNRIDIAEAKVFGNLQGPDV